MKTPRLTTVKPKLGVSRLPNEQKLQPVTTKRTTGRARQANRLNLWLERGQCCAMCGRFVEHPSGYHVDHIVPLALGGPDTDENKQLLCWWMDDGVAMGCHVEKTRTDGSHGW